MRSSFAPTTTEESKPCGRSVSLATTSHRTYPYRMQEPFVWRAHDNAKKSVPGNQNRDIRWSVDQGGGGGSSATTGSLSSAMTQSEEDETERYQEGEFEEWRIDEGDLLRFPSPCDRSVIYYPRNPYTSYEVSTTKVSLPELLDRIRTFLRVRSISTRFRPQEATIHCRTAWTYFVVQLWRIDDDDDTEYASPSSSFSSVVVDVQRRQGCCLETNRLRRRLFRAIETGQLDDLSSSMGAEYDRGCAAEAAFAAVSDNSGNSDSRSCFDRKVPPLVKMLYRERLSRIPRGKAPETHGRQSCSEEDIARCEELLRSDCRDQNRLGIESLVFLTRGGGDSSLSCVCADTAKDVARTLLYEPQPQREGNSCCQSLRDAFCGYLRCNVNQLDRFDSGIDTTDFSDAQHRATMHSLALQVLANALKIVVGDNDASNSNRNIDLSSEFWREVARSLTLNLSKSAAGRSGAQVSYLSAKSLSMLEALGTSSAVNQAGRGGTRNDAGAAADRVIPRHSEHLLRLAQRRL